MPFKQRFERQVNRNMRKGLREGPAPRRSEDHDMDLKKSFRSPPPEEDEDDEMMDEEMHDRQDRPPRFSTIFGAPPAPTPAPIQYIERPSKRRAGVFMPMPLFVLFMLVIFFESTILFAYTILGIYNNAAPRLFGTGGTTVCAVNPQPYVNISPNFLLPQAPPPVTVTPWITSNDGLLPDMATSSVASTTTTSSSVSTSSQSITSTTSTSTSSTSTTTSTPSTNNASTSTSTTSASETSSTSSSSSTVSSSTTPVIVKLTIDAPQAMATVTSVVIATGPPPPSIAAASVLAAVTDLAGLVGPI